MKFLVVELRSEEAEAVLLRLNHERKLILESDLGEAEWKQLRELQKRWRGDGARFVGQLEKAAKGLRGLLEESESARGDSAGQGDLFRAAPG